MLTVYTKNNCNACAKAKATLDLNGIEYKTVNVDEDFAAFDFIISENHRTFPQIYKDDGALYVVGGYAGLKELFQKNGFKTI